MSRQLGDVSKISLFRCCPHCYYYVALRHRASGLRIVYIIGRKMIHRVEDVRRLRIAAAWEPGSTLVSVHIIAYVTQMALICFFLMNSMRQLIQRPFHVPN